MSRLFGVQLLLLFLAVLVIGAGSRAWAARAETRRESVSGALEGAPAVPQTFARQYVRAKRTLCDSAPTREELLDLVQADAGAARSRYRVLVAELLRSDCFEAESGPGARRLAREAAVAASLPRATARRVLNLALGRSSEAELREELVEPYEALL